MLRHSSTRPALSKIPAAKTHHSIESARLRDPENPPSGHANLNLLTPDWSSRSDFFRFLCKLTLSSILTGNSKRNITGQSSCVASTSHHSGRNPPGRFQYFGARWSSACMVQIILTLSVGQTVPESSLTLAPDLPCLLEAAGGNRRRTSLMTAVV